MIQKSSHLDVPATTIVSRCPTFQRGLSDKRIFDSACSSRVPRSYQARDRLIRRSRKLRIRGIKSFNSPQLPRCNATDRDGSLGFGNECFRRPIRSNLNYRISTSVYSISDEQAAKQIEKWITKRHNDQLTVRIFRNLINGQTKLDDDSLNDLLLTADKTIFQGRLSGRVQWRWSDPGQKEYECELLGTTALLNADPPIGGFKTAIVLSKPLLQSEQFSRDLLLSTFLHELVHCYLFIQCGLAHTKDDGHTEGFRTIARLIDKYCGQKKLQLCNMRANLDYFRVPKPEHHFTNFYDEGYMSRDVTPGSPAGYSVLETGYGHWAAGQ